jgi:hypothetical protein
MAGRAGGRFSMMESSDRLVQLLDEHAAAIVNEATIAFARSREFFARETGDELTRECLEQLLLVTWNCLVVRDTSPIVRHAEKLAEGRFQAGCDLREALTAFNVIEEAIWRRVLDDLEPRDLADALAAARRVLERGKEVLATHYTALVVARDAPAATGSELGDLTTDDQR